MNIHYLSGLLEIVVRVSNAMDPLSIILVTANLLAVVDNLYRGTTLVRHAFQDPKVEGLNVRFITERARYAEWKRRMGIETSDDVDALISKLPEDAQRDLIDSKPNAEVR